MDQRPCVIIGNWKMHKILSDASSFVDQLLVHLTESHTVGLAVPFTLIAPLAEKSKESPLKIGAQNMNDASEGAFTGEIAGKMLQDAGAQFVLLGHSERRRFFQENDAFINRKVKQCVSLGLQPILCIGETLEQKEAEETKAILEKQIREGLADLSENELSSLIIAYEPVWAIGTGTTPEPGQVQEVHAFCRQILKELFSDAFGEKIVLQYGGSVHKENASLFLAENDIDGLLIGGASLSLESFQEIVNDRYPKHQSEG